MLMSIQGFGQKNCGYKMDEKAIFENRNLDAFLNEFQKQKFTISNDKKEIPTFLIKYLDCKTGDFSIANPDEKFQDGCVVQKKLPKRQLTFLAKSKNILVMTYLTGGIGITSHFLFVKFDNNEIVDIWNATGMGATKPKTLEEIKSKINRFRNSEFGIHPNAKFL